jgi:hypothetical protein
MVIRVGVPGSTMSNVIPFKKRVAEPAPEGDIDIFTAVDAAIRDLRDIARGCEGEVRDQVDECRLMLELAFRDAVGDM